MRESVVPDKDEKIKHYLKLKEEAELALIRFHDNEHRTLKEYEELLIREGCPHPLIIDREKTINDGYSRWTIVKYKTCQLCEKIIEDG